MMMRAYCHFAVAACLVFFNCSCSDKEGSIVKPAAPTDVTVARVGNSVQVGWKDNSDNETGFSIWLKTGESDSVRVGITVKDQEQFVIASGLKLGESYYVGVRADGSDSGNNSDITYSSLFLYKDLSRPEISFSSEAKSTSSCIAFKYTIRNSDSSSGLASGICWGRSSDPTIDDNCQNGPLVEGFDVATIQVIPDVLLEYGVSYHFRAYLKVGKSVFYSDDLVAALGSAPSPISLTWKKLSASIPDAISVYETTTALSGHAFHAWYAVADLSMNTVEVKVCLPSEKATIDSQSASFDGNCCIMTNGGYFYGDNSIGIDVINHNSYGYVPDVRGSLKTADAEYDVMYHNTRGIFGIGDDNKAAVNWAGTGSSGYFYDRPLPSVKGESKYDVVSSSLPAAPISWNPKYAVTAGPVLLKNGKCPFDFTLTDKGADYYLSNFEMMPYDIFGPDQSPDRTAIGCTKDGKVILFICDGRISASGGATLTELAMIMKGLGCTDALNLDGGGSTGMMIGSLHVNDHAAENRAVKTTVGFFRKE